MGRYYSGDIDGKFWFALQSSDCADRFGVRGESPNRLEYYFDSDHLPSVEKEIKKIENKLDIDKVENFFKKHDSYDDEMLGEDNISREEVREYADLLLGRQIRDCIKETEQCFFEAEC